MVVNARPDLEENSTLLASQSSGKPGQFIMGGKLLYYVTINSIPEWRMSFSKHTLCRELILVVSTPRRRTTDMSALR
jgi:hypothetical protein